MCYEDVSFRLFGGNEAINKRKNAGKREVGIFWGNIEFKGKKVEEDKYILCCIRYRMVFITCLLCLQIFYPLLVLLLSLVGSKDSFVC